MTGYIENPWEGLCGAILRQAVVDARDERLDKMARLEAQHWLMSRNAEILSEIIDIDPTLLSRWVEAGCPCPEDSKTLFGKQYGF